MAVDVKNPVTLTVLLAVALSTCTAHDGSQSSEGPAAALAVGVPLRPEPIRDHKEVRPFRTCQEREGDARVYRDGVKIWATVRMAKSSESLNFDATHCQLIGETANRVGTAYLSSFTCALGDSILTDGFSPLDQEPTLRIRRGSTVLIELTNCVTQGGEVTRRSATAADDVSLTELNAMTANGQSHGPDSSMSFERGSPLPRLPESAATPLQLEGEGKSENFQAASDNPSRPPLHLRCRSMYGVARLSILGETCHGQTKLSSGSLMTFQAGSCRVTHKTVAKVSRDFCDCTVSDMRMTNEPPVPDERDAILVTSGGNVVGEFGRCSRSETESTD